MDDAELVLVARDYVANPDLPMTEEVMTEVVHEWYRQKFAEFPVTKPTIEIILDGVTFQAGSSRVLALFINLNSDCIVAVDHIGISLLWKDKVGVHVNVYKDIWESLCSCPLVKVDISEMSYPEECLGFVKPAFSKTTLRKVVINDSSLGAEEMKHLAQVLTNVFPGTKDCPAKVLTEFAISRSNAGQEGASAVAAILSKCESLIRFEYADCDPGIEGSAAIADGLYSLAKNCSPLEILDLQGFRMTDAIYDNLCSVFWNLPKLIYVNLSHCQLSIPKQVKLKAKVFGGRDGLSLVLEDNEGAHEGPMIAMTQDVWDTLIR